MQYKLISSVLRRYGADAVQTFSTVSSVSRYTHNKKLEALTKEIHAIVFGTSLGKEGMARN